MTPKQRSKVTGSTANGPYVGLGYHHDDHKADESYQSPAGAKCSSATRLNKNRASNVPVTIDSAAGMKRVKVN